MGKAQKVNFKRVCRKTGYNLLMALAIFTMRLLEVTFFVGLAGSTIVVLISFVEDAKELFGKDEKDHLTE
jgi:hypothetical protein